MNSLVNPDKSAPPPLAAALREVVRKRRSTYSYLDRRVPRTVIEHALANAVLAPNHHRTAPWRFWVVGADGRDALVKAYESAAARVGRDIPRSVQRAKDAPVNVVVACVPAVGNQRVIPAEEEFATACAVQIFMLSLAAFNVDCLLTTGDLAESPEVARMVGLDAPGARLMGVINVGYRNPERPIQPRPDPPLDKVVTWIDEV